ncbi:MAG: hypothetical protein JWP44_1852 [Mucilaginibacter sp.]|nr:hypothetical protein [Mucilaginibacter sp.]
MDTGFFIKICSSSGSCLGFNSAVPLSVDCIYGLGKPVSTVKDKHRCLKSETSDSG